MRKTVAQIDVVQLAPRQVLQLLAVHAVHAQAAAGLLVGTDDDAERRIRRIHPKPPGRRQRRRCPEPEASRRWAATTATESTGKVQSSVTLSESPQSPSVTAAVTVTGPAAVHVNVGVFTVALLKLPEVLVH